jgi:NitT/TauT family transport system ATP-binding protein
MAGVKLDVAVRRKTYPGAARPALEHIAFTAAAGEVVALVGPSGSGKSTLLNIVAGLDQQVDARVELDGQPVDRAVRATVRVGMMFQASRLMPWLTVLDNLRLVLDGEPDAADRARRLLAEMGLEGVEDLFPRQLSGGMQRRVALARALAVRPHLLLLDEPLVSLDSPTAARLRETLLDLRHALRPTVLYVTHDLREALAVADRVLFLSRGPGRLVADLPVDVPRPRQPWDPAVTLLHDRLLAAHPDLLAGDPHAAPGGEKPTGGRPGEAA